MKYAYIFTTGGQMEEGFAWYIDYYKTPEAAAAACKPGWQVMRACYYEWRR